MYIGIWSIIVDWQDINELNASSDEAGNDWSASLERATTES